jgi:hypothetical protein
MDSSLFLAIGLLFPAISWLTLIAGYLHYQWYGRSSSGVYVPFVGPVLLDLWLLARGEPGWALVVPWLADLGTLFFLVALPRLARDAWQTSRFTRLLLLSGEHSDARVELSLHRGGHYVLRKHWNPEAPLHAATGYRPASMSEPGLCEEVPGGWRLTSHAGRVRLLLRGEGPGYAVRDRAVASRDEDFHNINGCLLRSRA